MGKPSTFAEYLRACRLEAGYGLRAFAEAIEMQPPNLSNIEHGRANPPQDRTTLTKIADTLGRSGARIMTGLELSVIRSAIIPYGMANRCLVIFGGVCPLKNGHSPKIDWVRTEDTRRF